MIKVAGFVVGGVFFSHTGGYTSVVKDYLTQLFFGLFWFEEDSFGCIKGFSRCETLVLH